MVDLHCHILPGVDDGSKNLKMTYDMLRMAHDEGIREICATSHYYADMKKEDLRQREEAFEAVEELMKREFPDMTLYRGAEVFYEQTVLDKMRDHSIPTLNGTNYVLVEFPVIAEFNYIFLAVQQIRMMEYYPVIAHVERYQGIKKAEDIERLIDRGALIQVNSSLFDMKMPFMRKRMFQDLIRRGMVHVVGTDSHSTGSRRPRMAGFRSYVEKKFGERIAEKICVEHAHMILKGERFYG